MHNDGSSRSVIPAIEEIRAGRAWPGPGTILIYV